MKHIIISVIMVLATTLGVAQMANSQAADPIQIHAQRMLTAINYRDCVAARQMLQTPYVDVHSRSYRSNDRVASGKPIIFSIANPPRNIAGGVYKSFNRQIEINEQCIIQLYVDRGFDFSESLNTEYERAPSSAIYEALSFRRLAAQCRPWRVDRSHCRRGRFCSSRWIHDENICRYISTEKVSEWHPAVTNMSLDMMIKAGNKSRMQSEFDRFCDFSLKYLLGGEHPMKLYFTQNLHQIFENNGIHIRPECRVF